MPSTEVVGASRIDADARADFWQPSAAPGSVIYFTLLYTAPGVVCSGWPGRRAMGAQLVWQTELSSGTVVWLVTHEALLPEEQQRRIERYRVALRDGMRQARPIENEDVADVRALLSGPDDDGSWFFCDLVVFEPVAPVASP